MFKKSVQTFKPHKKVPESEKQAELQKYAHATLGLGDLKAAVKLPEGEDLNEWLAVNSKIIIIIIMKSIIFFF